MQSTNGQRDRSCDMHRIMTLIPVRLQCYTRLCYSSLTGFPHKDCSATRGCVTPVSLVSHIRIAVLLEVVLLLSHWFSTQGLQCYTRVGYCCHTCFYTMILQCYTRVCYYCHTCFLHNDIAVLHEVVLLLSHLFSTQ